MPDEPTGRRDLVALGFVVQRLRKQRGLTQRQLATASRVHWRTILRIEHGEMPVTIDKMYNVAAALDASLSTIIAAAELKADELLEVAAEGEAVVDKPNDPES